MKILLGIILIIILTLFFIASSVPSGQDADEIQYIGNYIEKKYEKFSNRNEVEKKHTGKTYYVGPSPYTPTIIFYEITTTNEINKIEIFTKEALQTSKIDKVKLEFFEKQNFIYSSGGTMFSRKDEKLIKETTIFKK